MPDAVSPDEASKPRKQLCVLNLREDYKAKC